MLPIEEQIYSLISLCYAVGFPDFGNNFHHGSSGTCGLWEIEVVNIPNPAPRVAGSEASDHGFPKASRAKVRADRPDSFAHCARYSSFAQHRLNAWPGSAGQVIRCLVSADTTQAP